MASGRTPLSLLLAALLALLGCNREASKVTDRFLEALAHDDYPTAFSLLHSDARAFTPDAAALRAQVERSGLRITGWSTNCGSSGEMARNAYNVTTENRSGVAAQKRPLIVGVAPGRRGRCNGPMVVELKQEQPGTWRVRSLQL